jgi:hypothetical protein
MILKYAQHPSDISCLASSSVGLLFADVNGNIQLLGPDFEPTAAWVAHQGGRVTHMAERDGVLFTMGVRFHHAMLCAATTYPFSSLRKRMQ